MTSRLMLRCFAITAGLLVFAGCRGLSRERTTAAFVVELSANAISDRTLSGEADLPDKDGALDRYHRALIEECGHEPNEFVVLDARVAALPGDGKNRITRFEEVVSGPLTVATVFEDGERRFKSDFGTIESPQGSGPLQLAVPDYLPRWFPRGVLEGQLRLGVRAETDRTAEESFALDVRVEVDLAGSCDPPAM